MTTATAPRTTKNRERELDELLAGHQAEVDEMERLAATADQDAAALEQEADALASDLSQPLEAVQSRVEGLRDQAQRRRQAAADLRRRAGVYAEQCRLESLRAERDSLARQRRDKETRDAETREADDLVRRLGAAREQLIAAMVAHEGAVDELQLLHRRQEALAGRDIRTSTGQSLAGVDFLPGHVLQQCRDEAARRHEAK